MKRTVAVLGLVVVAVFGVVTAVPASAAAADTTVNLTLNCGNGCTGSWQWYQGGTLLSSGSISGSSAIAQTRGTTVQPAAADGVIIGLFTGGAKGCGASARDSFSPGSPISVTVKIREQANAYHNGCFATFTLKS